MLTWQTLEARKASGLTLTGALRGRQLVPRVKLPGPWLVAPNSLSWSAAVNVSQVHEYGQRDLGHSVTYLAVILTDLIHLQHMIVVLMCRIQESGDVRV